MCKYHLFLRLIENISVHVFAHNCKSYTYEIKVSAFFSHIIMYKKQTFKVQKSIKIHKKMNTDQ